MFASVIIVWTGKCIHVELVEGRVWCSWGGGGEGIWYLEDSR